MPFTCSWCNHLIDADIRSAKAVRCPHCNKWLYSPNEPTLEREKCPKCDRPMTGTVCTSCLPKF